MFAGMLLIAFHSFISAWALLSPSDNSKWFIAVSRKEVKHVMVLLSDAFFIYLFLHVDLNAAAVFEAVEISLLGWKLIMVAVAYEGVDGMGSLSW